MLKITMKQFNPFGYTDYYDYSEVGIRIEIWIRYNLFYTEAHKNSIL